MATTTKPKIQVQALFDLIVEQCRKVKTFSASPAELAVMREAFDGIFNKAFTATRKSPLPWCGFARRDGVVDEAARRQCLQSAFTRLLHYHLGKSGAYLGTIINAHDNLRLLAHSYGLCPHPEGETKWYMFSDYESPEAVEARRKQDENRVFTDRFADNCDTFCQVMVFLNSRGAESSVPGAEWRRVLLGR